MRQWLPNSLMGRLILGKVVVAVLLVCLTPLLVGRAASVIADRTIHQQLETDAATLARFLVFDANGWRLTIDPYAATSLARSDAATGYALVDKAGQKIFGSITGFANNDTIRRMAGRTLSLSSAYSYTVKPVTYRGRTAAIIVYRDRARSGAIVEDVVRTVAPMANRLVALVLTVALAMSVGILMFTMRGIARAMHQASRIDPHHLDARVDTTSLPDDIRGFVQATNDAFDRVEEGFRFQSRFAAAVAHEMRTPIAILRLKCESLPASDQRDGILAAVDRQVHILKQLTALASVEGQSVQIEPMDLTTVARDAAADMAMEVVRSGRTFEFDAPQDPVYVRGNGDFITTIIYNLVGNSIRHTPIGTRIVVCVGTQGTLEVVDDGPGMVRCDANRRNLTMPGYARADGIHETEGSGLGLRIVARSMLLMRGHLTVITDSPGAHIRAQLPITSNSEAPSLQRFVKNGFSKDRSSPKQPIIS